MFQLVASSKSEKVLILVLCPVGLGVLLKPVCIMKERFKNRDHRILDFCSTKMTLFKGAEIIYMISERSVHCVVYCIVTCGARYCNQSTPNTRPIIGFRYGYVGIATRIRYITSVTQAMGNRFFWKRGNNLRIACVYASDTYPYT